MRQIRTDGDGRSPAPVEGRGLLVQLVGITGSQDHLVPPVREAFGDRNAETPCRADDEDPSTFPLATCAMRERFPRSSRLPTLLGHEPGIPQFSAGLERAISWASPGLPGMGRANSREATHPPGTGTGTGTGA